MTRVRIKRVELAGRLDFFHVDAQLLEHVQGQAGFDSAVYRVAAKLDIASAHQGVVAIQVNPVIAGEYAAAGEQ